MRYTQWLAGAWNSNGNIPTGEITVKIMKYTFIFPPENN
jgi:hypothetical protein